MPTRASSAPRSMPRRGGWKCPTSSAAFRETPEGPVMGLWGFFRSGRFTHTSGPT
ncbi:hypothetical protein [Ralstonia phage phiITL-1]|uniref:Uncharacterized protein n=1 Tax=Ralstonia phage phiITL-1 TaxID=1597967 RepID=A0A0U1ZEH1_9CAUD|nr:hypothetical protein HOR02_gp41 [Ralstonia phage phiITL-1]AJT60825.1 hypothetical protein [Ralstonia phage phiITL-1]